MANLIGQYHTDNSNLVKPDLHLVIATRKKTTPKKPLKYLLRKDKGGFRYLSSLYLFEPETGEKEGFLRFSFDYEGKIYLLTIQKAVNQATITEFTKITQFTKINNISELGEFNYPKNPKNAGI
jgi:hypothetical protein